MNEKRTKKESKVKILYIVFSVVTSIALWMYVAYVQNPEKSVSFNGINVNFVGEEVLLENNLIFTDKDTPELSLNISGKRNTITKLDSTDITATVDLSEIVETYSATAGVYQLPYTLDYGGKVLANSVNVSGNSKNYVSVTVEKVVSTPVMVTLRNNVKTAENYVAEDGIISDMYINVSGPQSVVSTVTGAVVEVTREDLSKTVSEDVPITLINEAGEKVESDFLTVSKETVGVTIPVLLIKEVPLDVGFNYSTAVSEENIDCTISPETIRLSGDPEQLGKLEKIFIGNVDVSTFNTDVTKKFDIAVPGEFTNISEKTTAKVIVKLENIATKKYAVTTMQTKSTPIGRTAKVTTTKVDVVLRGAKDVLDQITKDNIRIVADLSSYTEGMTGKSFPAEVMFDDNYKVDVMGEYKVDVNIE